MMRQIKMALAFILGAIYMGCIFWWASIQEPYSTGIVIIPAAVVFLGGAMIGALVIRFFAENWDK